MGGRRRRRSKNWGDIVGWMNVFEIGQPEVASSVGLHVMMRCCCMLDRKRKKGHPDLHLFSFDVGVFRVHKFILIHETSLRVEEKKKILGLFILL